MYTTRESVERLASFASLKGVQGHRKAVQHLGGGGSVRAAEVRTTNATLAAGIDFAKACPQCNDLMETADPTMSVAEEQKRS